MAGNFQKARVSYNEVVASTYHDFWIEFEEPFVFAPGQFVSVKVNEQRVNSYSIAGRVDEKTVGLIVDVKPGGPGSQFFTGLKVGDEIECMGPLGKFVLQPDDGAEHLLFMGTGSGIAPLKAMIETALHEEAMAKPMTLYFGLRHKEDIFWDKYFCELQDKYENFEFNLCLSKPDEGWQGLSGHITDFLKDRYQDYSRFSAYLCGAEAMIKEASEILRSLGMQEDRVYHEKFY